MTSTVSQRSFKSFEESTRADWDVISPQLEVTQSMVADHILDSWATSPTTTVGSRSAG